MTNNSSVDYSTSNLTATAGSDYTATSGTLSWTSSDPLSKTITVPILEDSLIQGTEGFHVGLSNPTGDITLGLAYAPASVAIVDDDPQYAYSAASYSVNEGSYASITVTINTVPSSGSASVS